MKYMLLIYENDADRLAHMDDRMHTCAAYAQAMMKAGIYVSGDRLRGVSTATSVRVQFSRDIDPATIKGRVRASYVQAQSRERGEPDTPPVNFTTQYNAANRVLEIRFSAPLERFRTLKLDLLEGIAGVDGQPLKPWTLTFALGGA